jgi:hypothetical protein
VTLFVASELKTKGRRPGRERRSRVALLSGMPRLVESSRARRARAHAETWEAFIGEIRRSAEARLILLEGHSKGDLVACPWARLTSCDTACRCGGAATVRVEFLRDHYKCLATEISLFARRST